EEEEEEEEEEEDEGREEEGERDEGGKGEREKGGEEEEEERVPRWRREKGRRNKGLRVVTRLEPIVLYGSREEKDWGFDRYYRHEITAELLGLGLRTSDRFYLRVDLTDVNGTSLPDDALPGPAIIYVPRKVESENSKW
ncbi:hypothetical protein Ahia01_000990200, partial [Argonauta hians]